MGPFSRRDLLRGGRDLATLLSLSTLAGVESPLVTSAEAAQDARRPAPDVYRSIGVKPLVNARGTFTIISGSLMLPEVRAAMDAAARQYVHLDELAEAIGARLATLTGAEWGLVTSGCSAALTHATAACIAGGNPDLHVRIPNLAGFAKDEVIIPRHSRNVYDAAVRAVGARVIEVNSAAELEAALGPRTAMIYVLAGTGADQSALNLKAIAQIANPKGVPILVDAAAEILTIPNVHLQNGAALVGYSGGKCLRGPQTAGLLLGRKDLVRAAWVHSAPHHGPGRAMKVGKEEAIGMLTAVEMWVKRDHDAEWKQWTGWLDHISRRLTAIPGVTTTVTQPGGLSNRTPSLRVWWDPQTLRLLRRDGRAHAARDRAADRTHGPAPAGSARGDRRRRHSVHDVTGRRNDRGRSTPCAAHIAIAARPGRRHDRAGGGSLRPVERAHRVRRRLIYTRAASQAEGQRRRRLASRGFRVARSHRNDQRQRRAPAQQLRRKRRLAAVHVYGKGVAG